MLVSNDDREARALIISKALGTCFFVLLDTVLGIW